MRVTVTGAGYLGVTLAACLASIGHDITVHDTDQQKTRMLAEGRVPFREPGLDALLAAARDAGRIRYTTDPSMVAAGGDTHFLCVGTPESPSGDADLTALYQAAGTLVPLLPDGALLTGCCTVPPGTAAALTAKIARPGVEVAWTPEFLREGTAVWDTLHPSRLVFGVTSPGAEKRLRDVYAPVIAGGVPVLVMTPQSAELVKMAANSFLAAKISFINGVSEVAGYAGADIRDVTRALACDPRIGGDGLHPGLGFGGGCLPKDLHAMEAYAADAAAYRFSQFLSHTDRINMWQRVKTVTLAKKLLGGFTGKRVVVLGAAFKPGTSDTRDSPGLAVAAAFRDAGAAVTVHDPVVTATAAIPVQFAELTAIHGADLVVLATAWADYQQIEPRDYPPGKIIDARFCVDRARWEDAGWEVHTL